MKLWCITIGFGIFGFLFVNWLDAVFKAWIKSSEVSLPAINYILAAISFALIAYGIFK